MSPLMDRSKRTGRYLEWKVRIFVVGATLALGGMYLGKQWLVGVAILVLAGGMTLRFLPSSPESEDAPREESRTGGTDDEAEDPPES